MMGKKYIKINLSALEFLNKDMVWIPFYPQHLLFVAAWVILLSDPRPIEQELPSDVYYSPLLYFSLTALFPCLICSKIRMSRFP